MYKNVSEVLTTGGAKTADGFMVGLERGESTLAVSAMPGGWFIQVLHMTLHSFFLIKQCFLDQKLCGFFNRNSDVLILSK